MPSGNCTRKAKASLPYFYLQTENDVIPLATAALGIGFETTMRAYKDNGANAWKLTIEDKRGVQVAPQDMVREIKLGQVAVWDATAAQLLIMDANVFTANYTVP